MSVLEIVLSVFAVTVAAASVGVTWYCIKHCGRDHVVDRARVKRLVDNAPLERLERVLNK